MSLLDVLLPTDCAGCGAPGRLCCPRCRAVLTTPAVTASPTPRPAGLPRTWTVAEYTDPCRALLIAYKERGAVGLRAWLASALAAAITAAWAFVAATRPGPVVIVSIPSSRPAVRARGDDVVLGLARRAAAICRRADAAVRVVPALRHTRPVLDSSGLTASARAANLRGAFAVSRRALPRVAGSTVILADDLMTTGATLAEAAGACRTAGADVVAAATVASTQRWV